MLVAEGSAFLWWFADQFLECAKTEHRRLFVSCLGVGFCGCTCYFPGEHLYTALLLRLSGFGAVSAHEQQVNWTPGGDDLA